MIRITLVLLLSFSMFASEAGRKRKKKPKPASHPPVVSLSGGSSACTYTPPRLNPGENPVTYTLTLRQIGSNQGGPIYESCAEAQRRKQKEWLAQNFKPKPIIDVLHHPTACKLTPNGRVCNSCVDKIVPVTLGSFQDLLTHTDGSTGTITGQQIIGQSQACKVKNNKRVCTFCTKWNEKPITPVEITQSSISCSAKTTRSSRRVCESCIKKSIPATAGSFMDLLTTSDGSTGTITEQQIIGQSQTCQIKNNKKVCTSCTKWEEREGEAQAYLPHACTNNSDCTLVYTTCCGCDLGEKALAAVHVNDKSHYYKSLQDRLSCNANCHDRSFASSTECKRTAVCVNGTCLATVTAPAGLKWYPSSDVGGGGESEATQ